MSYTVIITEEIAANVEVTTQNYPITIEYNATNISAEAVYGNAEVAAYLASNSAVTINTTGNITAPAFVGNGAGLTGIVASTATFANTAGTANVANSVAGANVTGTVANATYATSAGSASTAGTANIALSVAGANVSGAVAQATQADTANIALVAYSVNAANVSGTVANATYSDTSGTAVTVTGAAQANITSVGTLSSLSVSGNVTGGTFLGNGAVPTGGDADTYLVKDSATNYDYSWTDRVNAKTIFENVKNVSGSTLAKGTPVYQLGVTGNTITVGIARADDPAKLAVGVLDVTLADQAEGRMLVLGEIKGVDTSAFATGDEIYLGATGGYTNVKPTSSSVAIQFLGVVNRIDASNGSGFITGTLTPDAIKYDSYTQTWTGTAWVPTTELSSDTSPALGGDLASGAYNISGTGNVSAARVTTTSDVIVGGNLTVNGDTVYTNVTSFEVQDPIIEMGRGANDAPLTSDDGKDRGERMWYYAGSEKAAFAGYDNSAGKVILATDVSITDEVVTVNNFGNTQVGNLDAVNVTATAFSGSGAALSNIAGANVTGTVANATYATSAGSASTATSATTAGTVTDAAQGNITSVGTLSSLSVTGNITTSGQFVGDGSALTNLPTTAPGGSDSQIQFNDGGVFAGNAAMTFNDSTGNIALGNVIFNVNNAASQINNIQDMNTSTGSNPGRIVIGNGFNGNTSNDYDFLPRTRAARVAVWGSHTQGSETTQASGLVAQEHVTLTANTNANLNSRSFAMSGILQLGGGASAYNFQQPYAIALAAQGGLAIAGTSGNANVGNTVVTALAGTVTGVQAQSGATVTNAVGYTSVGVTAGGTITNFAAFAPFTSYSSGTAPTSYSILFNPSSGAGSGGVINSNSYRSASNYYFLKNDDDVAQNRLGSLRRYHEFNGVSGTTSGSLTIDKTAGQVQQVDLTGAVTSLAFSNFVTSASDSVNTDEQCDTVTVVFNQGATGGYDVTFPTGSTYKYAGGVTALSGTTANGVSLVSISAIRISGTTTYLITISPEFV